MWKLRLLVLVCLLIGIRESGIAWMTLTRLNLYQDTGAVGASAVRIVVNAGFGIAFLAIAPGLWWRRRWAYRALPPLVVMLAVFNFLWLASYTQADYDRKRLAFSGVTSVLGVGFIVWLWHRLRTF